ncbi:hypothetical protein BDN67DRAFT_364105 [Paxillus ammoniavirescens]|nr:hypothetical protein BDN67DRAFT_364105 [Paxillus ammoniavirescens]
MQAGRTNTLFTNLFAGSTLCSLGMPTTHAGHGESPDDDCTCGPKSWSSDFAADTPAKDGAPVQSNPRHHRRYL